MVDSLVLRAGCATFPPFRTPGVDDWKKQCPGGQGKSCAKGRGGSGGGGGGGGGGGRGGGGGGGGKGRGGGRGAVFAGKRLFGFAG